MNYPGPGVYYLTNDTQLLYIGSSSNIRARIYQHRRDGTPFTQVFYNAMPDSCERARHDAENEAIRELGPRLNERSVSIGSGPVESDNIRQGL
jgi:excinuclease UvrABC nuclease subunit